MKKRMGFVSNSSSTSFVIGFEGVDQNIVDIIKGLFKYRTTRIWDDEAGEYGEYVDAIEDNSISVDIDHGTEIDELLDLEFLKKVGCTTKWDY